MITMTQLVGGLTAGRLAARITTKALLVLGSIPIVICFVLVAIWHSEIWQIAVSTSIGAAVVATVLTSSTTSSGYPSEGGCTAAFLLLAVVGVAGLVSCLLILRGRSRVVQCQEVPDRRIAELVDPVRPRAGSRAAARAGSASNYGLDGPFLQVDDEWTR
jgi:hypothetical protein